MLGLDGQFYHIEDLKHKYNIQGNFLDYLSVLRRIPAIWKTKINQKNQVCQSLKHNVAQNYYIQILCSDKKGCRKLYDMLIGNNIPTTPPPKWMNTIIITPEEWNFFNCIVRNTHEVKLKDFQFKIKNRILVTKSHLCKINKTDNDRCSLCDKDSETISHLFNHCDKAVCSLKKYS